MLKLNVYNKLSCDGIKSKVNIWLAKIMVNIRECKLGIFIIPTGKGERDVSRTAVPVWNIK